LDLLVQQVQGRLAQPVLRVQQARKDLQAQMELSELTVRQAQLAQRALVKPVRLVLQV
jgi:hypothetical protein